MGLEKIATNTRNEVFHLQEVESVLSSGTLVSHMPDYAVS
jgi:hypothetical protein